MAFLLYQQPMCLLLHYHECAGEGKSFSKQEHRLSLYYNIWSLFMFQLCLANSPFYLQISYINVL